LRGSLPLDIRPKANGSVERRPAVMFAPPHLHREPAAVGPAGSDDAEAVPAQSRALPSEAAVPGEEGFAALVDALLADPADGTAATRMARAADATYDFDQYVLLRERGEPRVPTFPPKPIPADPRWNRFLARAESGIGEAVSYALLPFGADAARLEAAAAALRTTLFGWWRDVCGVQVFNRLSRYDDADVARLTGQPDATATSYYCSCLGYWLMSIAGQRMTAFLGGRADALDGVFTEPYWEAVYTDVFAQYFRELRFSDPAAATGAYPFEPIPPDEVIFGLRVVHRQSWRQLAFGRGDLVGTVPLGPRESKKVSVKTTSRSKTSQTTEESRAFETSAEESSSSKDTTEVVNEATKKVNKHAEAEVSGGYPPFFSAKVSGGIAEDTGSSSKQTQSSLNEMMQKTASRMKRDSKVTVSVEGESTFEQVGSSELVNPNDEVAVTYLYHRLQQRFWVSTQIDEVNSVVLVPEPVPDFDEVDEDWVRAHGEILAGALLEPSFAGTLAAIRAEPADLRYLSTTVFDRSGGTRPRRCWLTCAATFFTTCVPSGPTRIRTSGCSVTAACGSRSPGYSCRGHRSPVVTSDSMLMACSCPASARQRAWTRSSTRWDRSATCSTAPFGVCATTPGSSTCTRRLGRREYIVDTSTFAGASRFTSAGFPRNSRTFWREMCYEYPFLFSENNQRRILSEGLAPRADDWWLSYHPSQAPYYPELHPITNPEVLE
jgi:HNH/Endo VII superfamily nuclease toxin with a HHH motif